MLPDTPRIRSRLDLLYLATREFNAGLDIDQVLHSVLGAMVASVGASDASLFLLDANGDLESYFLISGFEMQERSRDTMAEVYDQGLVGWVKQHRQGVVITDIRNDERWFYDAANPELTVTEGCAVSVPIQLPDRLLGILTITATEPGYFDDSDLAVLTIIADQAGFAIENARLFEAEQHRRRMADTLASIARTINSTLDLNTVLNLILEQLALVVDYDSSAVLLYNKEGQLAVRAARGFDDIQLALGVVLPLTETLPDYQALTQKRPVVLFDVDDEPGWVKTPASEWIRSWIGVPLIKLDEPMGILTINGHHKGMYTQEKANELVAFADQAATAVANAQTFTFLRNAEASYTALFEDSTDMIIIASYQGVILNVNRKACQMLRRSKEMLIGSDITLINPNLKRHLEHESARLKVWQETSLELDVINASGQAIYLELKARQVHYEGKDSVQWVGRDISARKELERIRQDSINMLVHDLRGPLGNLTTVIETLPGWVSEIEDDPAILEILEMANLSGQELRDLVDSLLDVSRLEQGRVPLQRSKVNLTDILSRVKEQVTPRAKNKYMELTINPVPQDVPEVMLDKNMIRRVLINLVDNAIKYTPVNGSISVKTTLTNEGLQIAVSDNGVGISPEDQANIFDKFSRVDHSTKSPAGVGLGLAFCKLATEAHGGTLTIDSSGIAGEGSTFYLTLPLIQPTSEQPS